MANTHSLSKFEWKNECKTCLTPYVSPNTYQDGPQLLILHNWRCENKMCRKRLKLKEKIRMELRNWEVGRVGTRRIEHSVYDELPNSKAKPIVANFDRASEKFGIISPPPVLLSLHGLCSPLYHFKISQGRERSTECEKRRMELTLGPSRETGDHFERSWER